MQKFDSNSERRFSIILEDDSDVLKWFKLSKRHFQIFYHQDDNYEPDFVVETHNKKFLCEIKRADNMSDDEVLAKAKAVKKWCEHATQHELDISGKPWKYILLPHDEIHLNSTLQGLFQASDNTIKIISALISKTLYL